MPINSIRLQTPKKTPFLELSKGQIIHTNKDLMSWTCTSVYTRRYTVIGARLHGSKLKAMLKFNYIIIIHDECFNCGKHQQQSLSFNCKQQSQSQRYQNINSSLQCAAEDNRAVSHSITRFYTRRRLEQVVVICVMYCIVQ